MPADNLTRIRIFAGGMTALAVAGIALGLATHGLGRWQVLVVLGAVAWIAEGRAMPVTQKLELSVSFIPIVLAAVLFGPAAGGLVGLAGMLGDRRGPWERFAIWASSRSLAGVVAGWAALWVGDTVGQSTLLEVLAVTLAAAIGYVSIDLLSTMVVGHLRGIMTPRQVWGQLRAAESLTMALYTPLTALYAYAYQGSGAVVLAFVAIPLLAAHLSYSLYARQGQLIDQLTASNSSFEDANRRLRRVNLSFAAAMVRALDARDAYTAGHSATVAVYSRDIAREMGMDDREVDLVHLTGLVHDIGKIGRAGRGAGEDVGAERHRVGRDAAALRDRRQHPDRGGGLPGGGADRALAPRAVSTAPAIRTVWRAMRSRCWRGSSRSPTPTTR